MDVDENNPPANWTNNMENDKMLNAIKVKFTSQSARNGAVVGCSPPKFTIPLLLQKDRPAATSLSPPASSLLQNGLKMPLSVTSPFSNTTFGPPLKNANNCLTNVAPLPQSPSISNKMTMTILQTNEQKMDSDMISLNSELIKLHLMNFNNGNKNAIDLTTALSIVSRTSSSSSNNSHTSNRKVVKNDFEIPFIDCDVGISSKFMENKLYQKDNSFSVDSIVAAPSAFGKILCKEYETSSNLHSAASTKKRTEKKYRHKIKRFGFDTKSPDDIVSESLKRFKR